MLFNCRGVLNMHTPLEHETLDFWHLELTVQSTKTCLEYTHTCMLSSTDMLTFSPEQIFFKHDKWPDQDLFCMSIFIKNTRISIHIRILLSEQLTCTEQNNVLYGTQWTNSSDWIHSIHFCSAFKTILTSRFAVKSTYNIMQKSWTKEYMTNTMIG